MARRIASPAEQGRPAALSSLLQVTAQRRKAAGTQRMWLVISSSGGSHVEEVGKHSIMRRTGLPGRDLRILDPMLSYPSTILGRERAIVVKLEHIKAIITATEVLVLNPKDPGADAFVKDLELRVCGLHNAQQRTAEGAETDTEIMNNASWDTSPPLQTEQLSPQSSVVSQLHGKLAGSSGMMPERKEINLNLVTDLPRAMGTKLLPFEFRVLEVCLESACRCLESETTTLEKEAYPALDELTSKISTLNLERVRQIKSRLVAISGRVQKVRDELEHLLDDDMDMAEMHLTEKLADGRFSENSSNNENDDDGGGAYESEEERYGDNKSRIKSATESISGFNPNIQELEMLLEAYFVQIEGTLNKLSTMREYVDDTEDYINIMLDDKQNQLLQMGVILSTGTLVISAGIVVTGLFGMNIHIELFDSPTYTNFWATTWATVVGCVILYIIALVSGKTKGFLS